VSADLPNEGKGRGGARPGWDVFLPPWSEEGEKNGRSRLVEEKSTGGGENTVRDGNAINARNKKNLHEEEAAWQKEGGIALSRCEMLPDKSRKKKQTHGEGVGKTSKEEKRVWCAPDV